MAHNVFTAQWPMIVKALFCIYAAISHESASLCIKPCSTYGLQTKLILTRPDLLLVRSVRY